jgi:glycosyltransferase involved in cell wall biosynthesis
MIKQYRQISMMVWNEFTNDARVLKEAETLQYNNYQVTVFALHLPGVTKKKEVMNTGVKVVRIPRSPLSGLYKSKATTGPINKISFTNKILTILSRLWAHILFLRLLIKSKPDAIHAHDVNTLATAWLAAKISRAFLVYDAHEISTAREGYASYRKIVGCIEKYLITKVSAVITTNDTRAKFLIRAYGISQPLVIQNWPKYIKTRNNQKIRNFLNLKENWPIVLYQGGLQQGRGLNHLIEAAASIPKIYFVFIGSGRIEKSLKELSVKFGMKNKVYFIPKVSLNELPIYTSSANIGIQPIENTCFNHFSADSNKVFEYIMSGIPIIASNLPEIRKLIKKYPVGLLFKQGVVEDLVKAINSLVNDNSKYNRFVKNTKKAKQNLCWERQQNSLVNLYNQLF